MPVFVYIILGIALLAVVILLSKVDAYVIYDNALRVYAKLWFIKINISIPQLLNRSKVKKQKKYDKRMAKKEKQGVPYDPKIDSPIVIKLAEIRAVLDAIFNFFIKKIKFRFMSLKVNVACQDAATTALVYAGVSQAVGYVIELLRNIATVDELSNSDVSINADFISQKPEVYAKIVLRFRVIDYLIFNFIKEPKNTNTTLSTKEEK